MLKLYFEVENLKIMITDVVSWVAEQTRDLTHKEQRI